MARTEASPSSAVAPRGVAPVVAAFTRSSICRRNTLASSPMGWWYWSSLTEKACTSAAAEVPRVEQLADHAALAAVDLEAFPPVHPYRDGEVELSEAAVGVGNLEEPAVRVSLGRQSRPDGL